MVFDYFVIAFAVICSVNALYFLFFLKFTFFKSKKSTPKSEKPTSVIVYIKNNETILTSYLEQLLKQEHKQCEFILVNNSSYDNSLLILEDFEAKFNNVHIVNVVNNEAFWGSKKYAISLGIKKANHPNLLFTTPEALPTSPNWISEINQLHSPTISFIIGYSNFSIQKGLFNKLIRFKGLMSNLYNFGLGSVYKPYTASKNNLYYTSSVFFEANGFSTHINVIPGTESLFLKQNANSSNVSISTNLESFVRENSILTFKEWLIKKALDLKEFKYYTFFTKFHLIAIYVSQLLFWILALIGLIVFPTPIILTLIGVRFLITGIIIGVTSWKFQEKDTFYLYPFMEFFSICIQIPIFITYIFFKNKH